LENIAARRANASIRTAARAVIDESAFAFFGHEHFIRNRIIDHARYNLARVTVNFAFKRDRDGKMRNAVQEICCAVQWVNNETVGFIRAFYLAAFFEQEAISGTSFGEHFNNRFFGHFIRARDEISWAFAGDLQMFDFVEIAQQSAGRFTLYERPFASRPLWLTFRS